MQFDSIPTNASVSFHLRACGITRCRLGKNPARYPAAVIGQASGGTAFIQLEGGAVRRFPRHVGYVIPPNALTNAWNEGSQNSVYRWSHVRFMLLGVVDLFQLVEIPLFTSKSVGEEIGEINEEQTALLAGAEPQSLSSTARRQELGFKLLRLILKDARWRKGARELLSGHARIQPALDYMQAHLEQPIARGQLAGTLFLSDSRFHDVFKNATGVAPLKYLQMLRLQRGQELLLLPDVSVADAGRRCGFSDQFHFSRQFKKAFGQSPLQYRKAAWRAMKQRDA